jgi:Na+/proline symporter
MELMAKGFNMFLGPLAALFFIGMFLPRCSSRSAVPAVLSGMAVSIGWSYWKELGLYRVVGADAAAVPTFTLAVAVPLACALLLAALLGYLVEPRGPRPSSRWTWSAIMRQQPTGHGDQAARDEASDKR